MKLREGNVFTPVCQSFCSQGEYPSMGVSASRSRGIHPRADTPPPTRQTSPKAHTTQADTLLGRHPYWEDTPWADTPPPDGYRSGRYASYWNAFLLRLKLQNNFRKRKKDNPYRETTVKFENHYDSLDDDDDDDDDVDKLTFTVQPHSRNPLTTEDINAEKLSNKYSWTVRDKSHKASSMGNKNIAEWIDKQIKPLDGAKRGRNSQNWSTDGQESDAITGQDSGDSDTELLHS